MLDAMLLKCISRTLTLKFTLAGLAWLPVLPSSKLTVKKWKSFIWSLCLTLWLCKMLSGGRTILRPRAGKVIKLHDSGQYFFSKVKHNIDNLVWTADHSLTESDATLEGKIRVLRLLQHLGTGYGHLCRFNCQVGQLPGSCFQTRF